MPTEKRQRQKEGRKIRLEARRKAQKRRQLVRRSVIVVIVAGVVVGSVFALTSSSSPTTSTTTTTTVPTRQVTQTEISAATATANAMGRIIVAEEKLTKPELAAAQARANRTAVAAGCPASTKTRVNTMTWPAAPKMTISTSAHYSAVVTTDLGSFTIALDAKTAPVTVNNFVFLARHGYYNCVIFQRVIPLFMNQTGDPTGTGSGGPGYTIPDELPEKTSNPSYQYPPGGVAMANGGPDTGGSQFFVVAGPDGMSLANNYSLFGQVTKGLSVVARINGQGNASSTANGTPPDVTHRMLSVKIIGPGS